MLTKTKTNFIEKLGENLYIEKMYPKTLILQYRIYDSDII